MVMYSMPQQAVTNGYWKSEYLRAQPSPWETIFPSAPMASSRRVGMMLGMASSSVDMSVLPLTRSSR